MLNQRKLNSNSNQLNESEISYLEENYDYDSGIVSKLLKLIFRLLLILIYLMLWLVKFCNIHSYWLYHYFRSYFIKITPKTKLVKLPKNLAICIGQEDSKQINDKKIVEIISWCDTLRIQTLTIYHYSEKLTSNTIANYRFKNISIQFISLNSSHESIVDIARKICGKDQSITSDQISNELRMGNYYKAPDPELLICFTGPQTLQAFPPWQIRLTEIIFLPSYKFLTQSLFLHELNKFANCVQRFGK